MFLKNICKEYPLRLWKYFPLRCPVIINLHLYISCRPCYNFIEVIKMKLMSFNTQHCLNYIRQEIDYQVMADAILKCGADVVGLNADEQENAVRTVIENLEPEKCILMGDFNVKPDNALLAPIRERMKDTAGLFPFLLMSFPSDRPNRKIDYIFVSPDIEIEAASIPPIVASDHRPHTAEIRL